MLAPRFKAKTIMLPETAPWLAELETELMGVTKDGFKSLFTDLVDCLAMQEQIAKPSVRSRFARMDNQVEQVTGYNPLSGRIESQLQEVGNFNPMRFQ